MLRLAACVEREDTIEMYPTTHLVSELVKFWTLGGNSLIYCLEQVLFIPF